MLSTFGSRRSLHLLSLVWFGLVTACSTGGDLGSCPSDADVEIAAGEEVLERRCNSCHRFAGDRVGGQAQELYDAVADGSMPPSGELSSVEAEQLRVFLACESDAGGTTP